MIIFKRNVSVCLANKNVRSLQESDGMVFVWTILTTGAGFVLSWTVSSGCVSVFYLCRPLCRCCVLAWEMTLVMPAHSSLPHSRFVSQPHRLTPPPHPALTLRSPSTPHPTPPSSPPLHSFISPFCDAFSWSSACWSSVIWILVLNCDSQYINDDETIIIVRVLLPYCKISFLLLA